MLVRVGDDEQISAISLSIQDGTAGDNLAQKARGSNEWSPLQATCAEVKAFYRVTIEHALASSKRLIELTLDVGASRLVVPDSHSLRLREL